MTLTYMSNSFLVFVTRDFPSLEERVEPFIEFHHLPHAVKMGLYATK